MVEVISSGWTEFSLVSLVSEAGDAADGSSSALSCAWGFWYKTQRSAFGGIEGIVSGATTLNGGFGLLLLGKEEDMFV